MLSRRHRLMRVISIFDSFREIWNWTSELARTSIHLMKSTSKTHMNPNSLPALHGITVLELGTDEAGQYCGRLLASLGARVIVIEPLCGISSRTLPPFVRDNSGRQRSVAHEYLNAGKESIALDLEDGVLESFLKNFQGHAQLMLHGSLWNDRLPRDLELLTVSTSLYGSGNGRDHAPTTSFTRFQAGGSGSLMPTSRPAAPGTLASECFSGAGIAVTVLALLFLQKKATSGPQIRRADHSEQAHLINLEKMFIGRVSKDKAVVTRNSHRYPFGGAVRCKDGFVSMLINEKHQWKGFCNAIGKPEWITDERFSTGSARFQMKDAIEEALHDWCGARTRAEVVEAMRSREVPIGSVNEISEIADNEVLRSRDFIRNALTPYGQAVVLSLPYGTDPVWRSDARPWAPLIGEQTLKILQELGYQEEELSSMASMNITRSEYASA